MVAKTGGVRRLLMAVMGAAAAGSGAQAAVTFTFDTLVSDTVPNSAPLVVTITEAQQADTVFFRVDASALAASEFVNELFFNVEDNLSLSVAGDNGAAGYDFCPYDTGCSDAPFNARGQRGRYDLLLDFPNAGKDNRLSGREVFEVTLTGSGLSEDSFSFGTTTSDYGKLFMVAKLQGLADGQSTHMAATTPEEGPGRDGAAAKRRTRTRSAGDPRPRPRRPGPASA